MSAEKKSAKPKPVTPRPGGSARGWRYVEKDAREK